MNNLAPLLDPPEEPDATSPTTTPRRRTACKSTVASVLFADVQRSMCICRRLAPEEWWTLMAGVYDVLSNGVHRFGGRVEQFTGDGLMAVFETPLDRQRHAHRACVAAAWCREAIIEHAASLERQGGPSLAMRIGIHSGDVVVGAVGEANGGRLATMGYTAALAKRVEALARPGSVYVTERTIKAAGLELAAVDLGECTVDGADSPVHIYRLR